MGGSMTNPFGMCMTSFYHSSDWLSFFITNIEQFRRPFRSLFQMLFLKPVIINAQFPSFSPFIFKRYHTSGFFSIRPFFTSVLSIKNLLNSPHHPLLFYLFCSQFPLLYDLSPSSSNSGLFHVISFHLALVASISFFCMIRFRSLKIDSISSTISASGRLV